MLLGVEGQDECRQSAKVLHKRRPVFLCVVERCGSQSCDNGRQRVLIMREPAPQHLAESGTHDGVLRGRRELAQPYLVVLLQVFRKERPIVLAIVLRNDAVRAKKGLLCVGRACSPGPVLGFAKFQDVRQQRWGHISRDRLTVAIE